MTLIIIPHRAEPEKCPKCDKPEDIIEVCNHCGYHYPEETGGGWLCFLSVILFLWLSITVMYWLMQASFEHDVSLFGIIKNQLSFLTNLRLF